MPRLSRQQRLDQLVAGFTELGPAWERWINGNLPAVLSYPRLRLLHALHQDLDQTMTMTELANALNVTQRRVTTLVEALENEGFVERRGHPTDGRSTVVQITAAGRAEEQRLWGPQQLEMGRAFGDLSVTHQRQLLEITPLLTEALRRRAAASESET